jgi:CheY-like chemotaxis protein
MTHQDPSTLLVDDDVDISANMADILGDLGYRVETAHDRPTALELVRSQPFDLALLDLRMPGMDGLTLYREIKKVRAGTEAILVTGFASGGVTEQALGLGALHVLSKPIDTARLMRYVEEALGRPLVLVVDDDRDLCENLCDLLHERGYRVCLAHGEAEAAVRLRDRGRAYRVVLIDLKLPDGDGGAVLRQVRAANPEAHAVLITGHRREMDPQVERLIAEGADAIHFKPLDVPELFSTVWQLA